MDLLRQIVFISFSAKYEPHEEAGYYLDYEQKPADFDTAIYCKAYGEEDEAKAGIV